MAELENHKRYFPYLLVVVWFIFTISLAAWWYLFAIDQTQRLIEIEHAASPALSRHLWMLKWEGLTLILCIVGGAAGMTYYIFREMRQAKKLQVFFSTFTHELRTPLASLRLQAESLKEDLLTHPASKLIDRLVSDTNRLALQLENSLFLAQDGASKLFIENINLAQFLNSLSSQWPDLKLKILGSGQAQADKRALECILRNVISNAQLHGQATEIVINLTSATNARHICLTITDNGKGFKGDSKLAGRLFSRLYTGSGNGIGLYLVKRLVSAMHGKVDFATDKSNNNFSIKLWLLRSSE